MTTTVYRAKCIVTLNGYRPTATAVAVRDGRILCVGTEEQCAAWGDHVVDDRFAEHVLMPGLVEAHGHVLQGTMLAAPYVGYFERPRPEGTAMAGIRSYDALIDRLRAAADELDRDDVLVGVGFDPIYFSGPRLDAAVLDRVSTTRPIFLLHASGHLATVNTLMLTSSGITRDTTTPGVHRGPDGEPDGELQEAPAMLLAGSGVAALLALTSSLSGVADYGRLCRNAGVTTTTDMANELLLQPERVGEWRALVDDADFPVRLVAYTVPTLGGGSFDVHDAVTRAVALRSENGDKLRFGGIKLLADGSLQGWTGCCSWPGYFTGIDHGVPQFNQDELDLAVATFHAAGLQVRCHANGDAAVEQFLVSVERALVDHAWLDHRHCVEHSQTTRPDQYRRMARLGVAASIFTNHIWYWGDQHYEVLMGPERVERMWACRSARDLGVSVSYHSDAGVTPVGQLHTAWCAVNRLTPSGRVLGVAERVSPEVALRAVTIEAAYQLRLDHEIGTIEAGKRADFTVLEEDPLTVDPADLRDVPVWGTVLGGIPQPGPGNS